MFLSIAQTVDTDNTYTQFRTRYTPDATGKEKIHIAFGYVNGLSLTVDEAKRLFLELEVSLREAYDDEEVTA